ncbi:hypothetical protein C3F09_11650 [candidate division GN15 bacterium]|uniref:DNA replication and repair protein RecF n=1 Tax=candidate division GN15 bacterium TaxID=2072418 RepID=A0A855WV06_9BACT|nr:MAG: hypothetical protein C3F09_11650 [candidate division GN15 bacterium]
MLIDHLRTSDFRNLSSLDIAFSPGANVFYGDNGSGKTNLLEALFVLCLGRSQRRAQDQVLVRNDCEVFRLVGKVRYNGRSQELTVAYQRGGKKKVELDGAPIRIVELFERHCVVAAGPEDSEIFSGPPSVRREFIDLYLSQYSRTYLEDLRHYYRALAQKNAALKREMDSTPFDALLARHGSRVMKARAEFTDALKKPAVGHYHTISGGEHLDLAYQPSIPFNPAGSIGEIESLVVQSLDAIRKREAIVGSSLIGPHRDDLAFRIMGQPAKTHGSQGQWRTAAISLKLALYDLLRRKRGVAPVLLLDEIFAELDTKRSHELINLFGGFDQLFLTTALEPPEPLRKGGCRYRIASGTVQEIH